MYSPEKLKELEAMDNESYHFYFKNGPEPKWTKEQWAELRGYQSQKKAERYEKMSLEFKNMTPQQKESLRQQLKKMEVEADLEVKRQLKEEALDDRNQ
jgi:hypothetical protein